MKKQLNYNEQIKDRWNCLFCFSICSDNLTQFFMCVRVWLSICAYDITAVVDSSVTIWSILSQADEQKFSYIIRYKQKSA